MRVGCVCAGALAVQCVRDVTGTRWRHHARTVSPATRHTAHCLYVSTASLYNVRCASSRSHWQLLNAARTQAVQGRRTYIYQISVVWCGQGSSFSCLNNRNMTSLWYILIMWRERVYKLIMKIIYFHFWKRFYFNWFIIYVHTHTCTYYILTMSSE